MISDEPDEDADALDDENLLESYIDGGPPKQQPGSDSPREMGDWPSRQGGVIRAGTHAWSKSGPSQTA
jgi:hypothetical protein